MQPPIELSRAGIDDLDAILHTIRVGFDTYTEFAPAGWTPRSRPDDRERTADLLTAPDTWVTMALVEGDPVGHVGFVPARERAIGDPPGDWRARPAMPGVAHLWQLFVLPDWWGAGVAATLHAAAVGEMAAQGYDRSRLYTPAAHTRACRFYERRGWELVERGTDPELGLELADYRLELS